MAWQYHISGRGFGGISSLADSLESVLSRFAFPVFSDEELTEAMEREDVQALLESPQSGRRAEFWTEDGRYTVEALESAPSAIPSASRPLYQQIAHCFQALLNCQESGNQEWESIWTDRLHTLAREALPSGSGFDSGTEFSLDESRADRLIFTTSFHHMDENGSYCGWTDHRIIMTPSFIHGFELKVTGTDKRGIKDYIGQVFSEALDVPADLPEPGSA